MRSALLFALAVLPLVRPAAAADIITTKQVSMELAADIAQRAVQQCRKNGYQVSAVVVDRGGAVQVVMRDALASRFTVEIARKKANAVVLSGVDSGSFLKSRSDIRMEMNHVGGIIMLEGGLPIRAGGSFLGAVGVSGAPGGDKDAACGAAALEAVRERLELAE